MSHTSNRSSALCTVAAVDNRVNPLATRYVAPGKLPWIDQGTVELRRLAERFMKLRRAQIVGVHGSGKSTLLEHLVPLLGTVAFRQDAAAVVHGNSLQDNLPTTSNESSICWFSLRRDSPSVLRLREWMGIQSFLGTLVLDGFEQLSWWQRWRVRRWTARQNCRLLVTAHRSVGLTTLHHSHVSEDLAKLVIRQAFQAAWGAADLPEAVERLPWEQLLKKHRGNLRECLMDVYDLVETLNREAN